MMSVCHGRNENPRVKKTSVNPIIICSILHLHGGFELVESETVLWVTKGLARVEMTWLYLTEVRMMMMVMMMTGS